MLVPVFDLPSLSREGAVRIPLGLALWPDGRDFATITVKTTWNYSGAGDTAALHLAHEQLAPTNGERDERAGATQTDARYPNDFVPMKAAADYILWGHAHAPAAAAQINVSLKLLAEGDTIFARHFTAVNEEPQTAIPLTAKHLRHHDAQGPATKVGAELHELDDVVVDLDNGDLSPFQGASAGMRGPALSPGMRLQLTGLRPGGETLELQLSTARPFVWAVGGLVGTHLVELVCDTLWLDSDREQLVLVWRGVVPFPMEGGKGLKRLLFAFDDGSVLEDVAAFEREVMQTEPTWANTPLGDEAKTPVPQGPGAAQIEVGPDDSVLTLDEYAGIAAELAVREETPSEVLKRHDMTPADWAVEDRAWLERMMANEGSGPSLAEQYSVALVRAKQRLRKAIDNGTG